MRLIILLGIFILVTGCLQQNNVVEIMGDGFHPKELAINNGETVIFVNKDTAPHWPASGMHPTHTDYPEPGGCIGSKFDACGGLNRGESFSFTFTQNGEWEYHDHLNSGLNGRIIVK